MCIGMFIYRLYSVTKPVLICNTLVRKRFCLYRCDIEVNIQAHTHTPGIHAKNWIFIHWFNSVYIYLMWGALFSFNVNGLISEKFSWPVFFAIIIASNVFSTSTLEYFDVSSSGWLLFRRQYLEKIHDLNSFECWNFYDFRCSSNRHFKY